MTIEVDDLYQYGIWARDEHTHLGAKSAWASVMVNNVEAPTGGQEYHITDTLAGIIDRAVCRLASVDGYLATIFKEHYITGLAYRVIAERHQCGKGRVATDMNKATGFVLGVATMMAEEHHNLHLNG